MWSALSHAYGPADDTPAHLVGLTTPAGWLAGTTHLITAVTHQGGLFTATAPAVTVVAELLAAGRVMRPAVAEVLDFLTDVAEAVGEAEQPGLPRTVHIALLNELRRAIAHSHPVVDAFLDDPEPYVRYTATRALVAHVTTATLADRRPAAIDRLRELLDTRPEARAHRTRALGELGADVRPLLADPDEHVRACAALAPGLSDDRTASEVLLAALVRTAQEGSTGSSAYHVSDLSEAAAARVADPEHLVEVTVLLVQNGDWAGFSGSWGPCLVACLPQLRPGSASRRAIIDALVENPTLWSPRLGDVALTFRRAGLPHDRAACARLRDHG
jgi:hypothetical protein